MIDEQKVYRKGGTAYLSCKLSREEVHTSGKSLAEAIQRKAMCEARLDEVKAQVKGEITQAEGDIAKFQALVSTEREYRMVSVDICFDFARGVKETIRTDTGEIVKTEALTDEDRQRELPMPPAEK